MAAKVTIDLVTDTRDFERQMKGAARATEDFQGAADKVGHGLGDARTQIKGTQSLLKGLHQVMDSNTQAAIDALSGYANLAKGIKSGLIPAMKQGATSAKAMSTALLATPWGRIAAAVVVLGAAIAVASKDTDQMGRTVDGIKEYSAKTREFWRDGYNTVTGFFGLGRSAAKETEEAMNAAKASADRYAASLFSAAQQAMRLRIAAQLGGTVDDPDGAFASAAAVAEMNDTMSGPIIDPNAPWLKKANNTAAKSGKTLAKTLAQSWADEFKQAMQRKSPLDVLSAALDRFKAKVDNAKGIKSGLKDLFKLDFGSTDYTNVPAGLKSQLKRWEKFIAVFGQLKKKHLHPSLLKMFADAGPAALEEMNKVNHASIKDINDIAKRGEKMIEGWANSETRRQTGVDVNKPGKVTVHLDIKGNSGDLKALIKKWVHVEGGGSVQAAFGK